MDKFIGIDIGGTNIKYGLLDEKGNILHKDKIKTSPEGSEIIRNIKRIVESYKEAHEISAVGISVPGVVEESGFLTTGGAIFDFYGIHLKDLLEKELGVHVTVENDANSAALAEKWLGAGRDYRNYFTAVVGTGIGGAIIINNDVYRGAHATAGEFGFMINAPILNGDTRLASVSLTSSVQSGLVQRYLDETGQETNQQNLDGESVFKLAESGDVQAKAVIDAFYDHLAIGIYNVLVSLDPEVVLIGGGISANQSFIKELNRRVQGLQTGHRDMKNMTLAEILPCHFLNDAGIVGASYKAMKECRERTLVKGGQES
ncbi:ROK family protein [Trichococcus sp. K1Tr]|uniref:ROK family protein n=1 Tax=Trichococcus sp. K1Tr TaxID=3020847 RepID=UPI00232C5E5E|nr:ROK family protein [Trichococcus sp. K1Tr]MDB6352728.1 ROK family protein [Trichococcus sp. K1Tr]